MYDQLTDGRLQVTAATSLLEFSHLVQWRPVTAEFSPVPKETFEFYWKRDIDPVFGRVICWINFSAGAEFLAKGICLLHGVEIRWTQEVPAYPHQGTNVSTWVSQFRSNPTSAGTITTTNFGTLGHLVPQNGKADAALARLCEKVSATHDQKELLLAAYTLLGRTIRNRDAHAYVPNVRDDHFTLVPDLFSGCFNLLVSWLPGGAGTLNDWKKHAQSFVADL
jgi:hypothetical protein